MDIFSFQFDCYRRTHLSIQIKEIFQYSERYVCRIMQTILFFIYFPITRFVASYTFNYFLFF